MNTTLWESLGGEETMTKVVNDFVDAVVVDPRVNYTRGGRYPLDAEALASTRRRSLEFISQALQAERQFDDNYDDGAG